MRGGRPLLLQVSLRSNAETSCEMHDINRTHKTWNMEFGIWGVGSHYQRTDEATAH
jgi:hypothetical protein